MLKALFTYLSECEAGEAVSGKARHDAGVSLAYTACMRHKCVFDKGGWMVTRASATICRVKGDV